MWSLPCCCHSSGKPSARLRFATHYPVWRKRRGRDSSYQSQTTRAARQLSWLRPCAPRTGAGQTTSQPAESSTSAASRPASIPRPEAQPFGPGSSPKRWYCRGGKGRRSNDNPRQLKLRSSDTSQLENASSQWWSSGMKFSSGVDHHHQNPRLKQARGLPKFITLVRQFLSPNEVALTPIPEDRPAGARSVAAARLGMENPSPSSQSPARRDVSRTDVNG